MDSTPPIHRNTQAYIQRRRQFPVPAAAAAAAGQLVVFQTHTIGATTANAEASAQRWLAHVVHGLFPVLMVAQGQK